MLKAWLVLGRSHRTLAKLFKLNLAQILTFLRALNIGWFLTMACHITGRYLYRNKQSTEVLTLIVIS